MRWFLDEVYVLIENAHRSIRIYEIEYGLLEIRFGRERSV
jgi:hypothetical protein